ncbi:sporulation inhibitor of replication protein SirA [Virgibacillus oceani]|uniref:Sporulation inhibitor of replication protein SirA n=1 Tax=Virgibacillus oceani TaxID=1479511 RepID=A0A917M550_9BACI|nr:sporulation inhibitor of replication protein SirA [Virgibacillus oceani]GGG77967.1 hypothetical protein GCM10011398_23930 [Virgibacillus oceani]
MGNYSIYWIKEEFAYRYFHKRDILYRFMKEYRLNSDRADLAKQYHFITNTFPQAALITHIKDYHQSSVTTNLQGNFLELFNDKHYISLHIHKKHLNFRCEMLHDAEKLLFPALRSFHPFLFIMGNDMEDYGWISPVTKERVHINQEVLYSYL